MKSASCRRGRRDYPRTPLSRPRCRSGTRFERRSLPVTVFTFGAVQGFHQGSTIGVRVGSSPTAGSQSRHLMPVEGNRLFGGGSEMSQIRSIEADGRAGSEVWGVFPEYVTRRSGGVHRVRDYFGTDLFWRCRPTGPLAVPQSSLAVRGLLTTSRTHVPHLKHAPEPFVVETTGEPCALAVRFLLKSVRKFATPVVARRHREMVWNQITPMRREFVARPCLVVSKVCVWSRPTPTTAGSRGRFESP